MLHEAKFEAGRGRLAHLGLHLYRHGGGIARPGRPQAQGLGKAGAGAIGHHQAPAGQALAAGQHHPPVVPIPLDLLHGFAGQHLGTGGAGLACQVGIKFGAAHDPEG